MNASTAVFYYPARDTWVAWIRDSARIIHSTRHPSRAEALTHIWEHNEETA